MACLHLCRLLSSPGPSPAYVRVCTCKCVCVRVHACTYAACSQPLAPHLHTRARTQPTLQRCVCSRSVFLSLSLSLCACKCVCSLSPSLHTGKCVCAYVHARARARTSHEHLEHIRRRMLPQLDKAPARILHENPTQIHAHHLPLRHSFRQGQNLGGNSGQPSRGGGGGGVGAGGGRVSSGLRGAGGQEVLVGQQR